MDTGLWLCFTCNARGNIKTLMKLLDVKRLVESADTSDILAKLEDIEKGAAEGQPERVYEETYLRRFQFPTDYWGPCPQDRDVPGCLGAIGCKLHRWYTPDTVQTFQLGYDPMENAATIPIRTVSGTLLGVIRRYLGDDTPFKYKYPAGFKRSHHMFGSWLVEQDPGVTTVAVVEGAADAMAVWQAGRAALGQYGSTISRPQIRLMRRLGVVDVTLLYDNPAIDKAGRAATRYAQGFHQKFDRRTGKTYEEYDPTTDLCRSFSVSTAAYPLTRLKDPAVMTSAQIISSLSEAKLIT
jgi:hypothetical protein